MKRRIINKIAVLVAVLSLGATSSCTDWLDVQPKTSINEEILFSKEQGFKEALTGLYMSIAQKSLFGQELSYGLVDGLAQRYRAYQSHLDYTRPDLYIFPSTMNENITDAVWREAYNVIANANSLLGWIEKNGQNAITTEGLHDIIKGETLALRAFVHFELLRLWGPIFSEDPTAKSIIYRTEFSKENQTLEQADVVAKNIIADLQEALILLENDPMHIDFSGYNTAVYEPVPFLSHRIKRLNRDAVKALLARAYLHTGDKVNAMKYAKEVINSKDEEGLGRYTLVIDNSDDRVFSTEILFSIHVNNFVEEAEDIFMLSNWTDYCSFDTDYTREIFNVDEDGINDIRFREGLGFTTSISGTICLKYDPRLPMYSEVTRNTIPIIRLPEMYYIVAECTTDLEEARAMLSAIRSARGTNEITVLENEEQRLDAVMLEYRKEFYAEGQLWYFYKRNFYKRFLGYEPTADMMEQNYIFATPQDEVSLGTVN